MKLEEWEEDQLALRRSLLIFGVAMAMLTVLFFVG
jgi:hypothetical protein